MQTTPRQAFIEALEGRPPAGRVPTFELVFYLTMQAFGKVHPLHRDYSQWIQMEAQERDLHRQDMAEIYIQTAERFEHSAIFVHPNPGTQEESLYIIDKIRQQTGERFFLMKHGDVTFSIPEGGKMTAFAYRMADDPQGLKDEAARNVEHQLKKAAQMKAHGGLDGYALCSDYCFNTGPFLHPEAFGAFIAPYLKQLTAGMREMGFYVIKHTDGNIMPILDQLLDTCPHALHSLDPQGGVDMGQVRQIANQRPPGERVALIGNVNCGLLDTGSDAQIVEAARTALRLGKPGGGYIFSTSNCVYTGMPLRSYALMLDVWRQEG